jgi:hypothetical protein
VVSNLLSTFPVGSFEVAPFIEDSASKFQSLLEQIRGHTFADETVITKWNDFASLVPLTDDPNEYVAKHPDQYHIPLYAKLFDTSLTISSVTHAEVTQAHEDPIPFQNTMKQSSKRKRGRANPDAQKLCRSATATTSHDTSADEEEQSIEYNWHIAVKPSKNFRAYLNEIFVDLDEPDADTNPWTEGKVVAIVESEHAAGEHFKYYNPSTYPEAPPGDDDENAWGFTPCKELTSKKNVGTMYEWKTKK